MNEKKSPVDLVIDLLKSDKMVKMSDIAEIVFEGLSAISDKTPPFKYLKSRDERLYNDIINTITSSLAVSFSVMGMTPDQTIDFIKNLDGAAIGIGFAVSIPKTIDKHNA